MAGTDSNRPDDLEALFRGYLPIITHDTRTPLTAIKGASGLLASGLAGHLTDHQCKLVDICLRNVDLAALLVQDVVDILRLESGIVERFPTELDVLTEARDIWDEMQPATTLPVEIVGGADAVPLFTDRTYVRRALHALMRFPQPHRTVERASLAVRSVPAGAEVVLACSPLKLDSEKLLTEVVRGQRQVPGRFPATGLEIHQIRATAGRFSAEFAVEAAPDDAFRVTLVWPNASR